MNIKKLVIVSLLALPLAIVSFLALPMVYASNNTDTVSANEVGMHGLNTNDYEVVEVSKEQIITEFAQSNGLSFEEALETLFPPQKMNSGASFRSFSDNEEFTSYVVFRAAAQYSTRTQNIPGNAGQVYFYCEVSTGGGFRGIKRIIYAGYNSGNYAFKGLFQYHLADPNRIDYTLNGGLYSNTTTTVNTGGSIGIGETASLNLSVISTSNYVRNLYRHASVWY